LTIWISNWLALTLSYIHRLSNRSQMLSLNACGPVSRSWVGGTEEALVDGESAYLVEPGDSGQLAAAVVKMLNSPRRLIEMGLAGQKKWRGEFTVDIMLNKVEQYLARFVN
jgi:glycosyltransferase involved in cell wall biosynthesis